MNPAYGAVVRKNRGNASNLSAINLSAVSQPAGVLQQPSRVRMGSEESNDYVISDEAGQAHREEEDYLDLY